MVRITIEELVALRNLVEPPEVRCHTSSKAIDRLLVLGLAEYKMFPPCPKKLKAARETRQKIIQWARERLTVDRITEVLDNGCARRGKYSFPDGDYEYPKEEKRLVATRAGQDLLAGTLTKVKLPKPDKKNGIPGCA